MSNEAVAKVAWAFARHGIALHIDRGEMGGGGQGNIPYSDRATFNTIDATHPDYPDYMDYYNNAYYFSTNRRGIFHYCLFVHDIWYNDDGVWIDTLEGISYPDNDKLMIAEDNMLPETEEQAGTFMHELGHNLGLDPDEDYEGIDSTDIPYWNYPSVMNYNWNWWNPIDYSSGTGFNDWAHIQDGDLTC